MKYAIWTMAALVALFVVYLMITAHAGAPTTVSAVPVPSQGR